MNLRSAVRWSSVWMAALMPTAASAFFFIIPIPNLAKPPALNALIDALEKSDETKAVAYASEDKIFGSKNWVWGHFAGHVTQDEADRTALSRCQAALANAKAQTAGGKQLYDFGTKTCELYEFQNKTVSAKATSNTPPSAAAPASTASLTASPAAKDEPQPSTSPTPPGVTPPASAPPPTPPAEAALATATTAQPGAAASSPQQEAKSDKSQGADRSAAERLRELNDLYRQGLITESEYNDKRKSILSTL